MRNRNLIDVLAKKTEELTKNDDIIFKYNRNIHKANKCNEFRFGAKVLIVYLFIFAVFCLHIYYQI
ncbi:unnamed protein product [Paramecium sonneborni]|uniref:Uncharacterized protein n=1 Tax=Paramecium sonneborni TaxID=65129 RepID=A0A8S1PR92_9CILI|nr:unnamed protein product [Paramecium sonneborni]